LWCPSARAAERTHHSKGSPASAGLPPQEAHCLHQGCRLDRCAAHRRDARRDRAGGHLVRHEREIDPDTGEAFGKGESTFTTSVHVAFTDGTRISFHEVAHVLFDGNGVVKVEFDKFKAHCG
jgi:hypothetical protein